MGDFELINVYWDKFNLGPVSTGEENVLLPPLL